MGSRKKNKAGKKHHKQVENDNETGQSKPVKNKKQSTKVNQQIEDFSDVNVFNSPLVSLKALTSVLFSTLKTCLSYISEHWMAFAIATVALTAFMLAPLPEGLDAERERLRDVVFFALYWIGLGVASSIGLGTGLHTFILYLGPHIAQVVIASNECNHVPELLPSRWRFEHFAQCSKVDEDQVTIGFWAIYQAVFLEAFLWGAGTAMGELPPYFVARAASAAGGIDEELEDILQDDHQPSSNDQQDNKVDSKDESCMDRSKKRLATFLKNHAFVTVLLMASIPNPLFDLAGLMCGHFQLPFMTFFLPTLIGKAVNKVSIQVVFIIVAFSKHMMVGILEMINSFAPTAASSITEAIDKQKQSLFQKQEDLDAKEEPMIKVIWEWCIFGMILYFIVTFFNALVRNQLMTENNKNKSQ